MKLNTEDKQMLEEYRLELNGKKVLSDKELDKLIQELKTDPYGSLRLLMESQLLFAYEIAKTYHHEELTLLDFVHAANEGLEIGVTSQDYNDVASFKNRIEKDIRYSIDLMLSYFLGEQNG